MASGNDTKVDTALLASTAETLSPLVKNLENVFEQFQQEIKNSRGEWQGDTSDDIRNTAAQLKSSSAEIKKVLNGYISGLKELAGVYDKAESKVEDTGKSLKFDSTFK
ncbi:MAG: WXG100 family type VII secretion target [Lachnospiraceae bacterium]|nr:WXG100 family type VII secretion target [Lachnospiraceae bacterium]